MADEESTETRFSQFLDFLDSLRKFFSGEDLSTVDQMALNQNWWRDFLWALASYLKWQNFFSSFSSRLWAKGWSEQWLAGALGIFIASSKNMFRGFTAENFITALAALFAIPAWNAGQDEGIAAGEKMGMSTYWAGFFAALFTGLLEGLVQTLMILLGKASTDPQERANWKEKYKEKLVDSLVKSIVNGLGGFVWQIFFNATMNLLEKSKTPDTNSTRNEAIALLLSILLAVSVLVANRTAMAATAKTEKKIGEFFGGYREVPQEESENPNPNPNPANP